MPDARPADEAAIREQAYYLWEQDGRPAGHDMEYWSRASVMLAGQDQMATLTKTAPRRPKSAAAKPTPKAAEPKVRSAAGKVRSAPSKSAKVDPKAKPKKK